MKLKPIASNMTELHLNNGTIVLFSYETPVASLNLDGVNFITNTRWSKTTSKHIGKWDKRISKNEVYVNQSILNELVK